MKLKRIILIVAILSSFFLTHCVAIQKREDRKVLQALSTAKMLYVTDNREFGVVSDTGETLIFAGEEGRWAYSPQQEILYKITSDMIGIVGYIDDDGREKIGNNHDGCGGGSLIREGQELVYVTSLDFLPNQDAIGSQAPYVLVSFGIESGHKILYTFPDQSSTDQSKRCFLGTNVEFAGKLYFSEAQADRQVVKSLDLSTMLVEEVFSDDIIMAPAISPNGKSFAYTKYDGIYLYVLDEEVNFRLVDIPWFDNDNYDFARFSETDLGNDIPMASWSPDSEKIVYSKLIIFTDATGEDLYLHNIYVHDISTGETNLLIRKARNPYWILP